MTEYYLWDDMNVHRVIHPTFDHLTGQKTQNESLKIQFERAKFNLQIPYLSISSQKKC